MSTLSSLQVPVKVPHICNDRMAVICGDEILDLPGWCYTDVTPSYEMWSQIVLGRVGGGNAIFVT
jgi:hypothetical protein